MSQRLRLYDIRISNLPSAVGLCQSDIAGIANIVNSAQRRLLYCKEAGEEGWYGGWAETIFTTNRTTPYVTFDNSVARLEFVDLCDSPISVNNQFMEYVRFGNGRMPKLFRTQHTGCFRPEVYSRNNVPTIQDLAPPPQNIAAFITDPTDVGKRVMIQGTDNNGMQVFTQDGFQRAAGQFATLSTPFVVWPQQWNTITGIQKDITNGPVQIFQMDPTTGAQVLLANMQPYETTAWYRRYFFHPLPFACCNSVAFPNICTPTPPQNIQVTAIVKLEFVPVRFDTDYCLIQNLEALTEEAMAVRYSTMDSQDSKALALVKHKEAVRFLNGEVQHYYGTDNPAINISVFGDAHLWRQGIGYQL
jgi:hypothetical protein